MYSGLQGYRVKTDNVPLNARKPDETNENIRQ